jgi:MFS family permease
MADRLGARTGDGRPPPPSGADRIEAGVFGWAQVGAAAIALVGVGYAIGAAPSAGPALRVVGAGFALVLAAAFLGAFLGLLFGLPREVEAKPGDKPLLRFVSNTNLLKVSDWLTTIVVGLTLVSLTALPTAAARLGEWLEPALGDRRGSAAFGVFLVVAALVGSFILMYLWTIVTLRRRLEEETADLNRLAAVVPDLTKAVAAGTVDRPAVERGLDALSDDELTELASRGGDRYPKVIVDVAREIQDKRTPSGDV